MASRLLPAPTPRERGRLIVRVVLSVSAALVLWALPARGSSLVACGEGNSHPVRCVDSEHRTY